MACSPSSGHNHRLARIVRVIVVGMPLMSGCSNQSHVPPFARVPYEPFSRAAVVAIALREWRLFGAPVNDDDHLNWDKPERNAGLWQRVGEYWYAGMNPGTPGSRWTGKHDEYGREFPPEADGNFAWSAAFVSYVMRTAGAANAFPYAADHAFYINAAKRMTLGTDRGWLVTAERPEAQVLGEAQAELAPATKAADVRQARQLRLKDVTEQSARVLAVPGSAGD